MDSPKIIRISWEKEYRFEVKSEYGVVEGSGWYKRGDEVTVSLSETLIDYGNSTRRRFVGWYENEKLIEEKPTTIKEVWRKDLNAFVIIMLLLISVAILGAIASRKILHRK